MPWGGRPGLLDFADITTSASARLFAHFAKCGCPTLRGFRRVGTSTAKSEAGIPQGYEDPKPSLASRPCKNSEDPGLNVIEATAGPPVCYGAKNRKRSLIHPPETPA